jgi:ABC-type sugar transport system ATPase subunit
MQLLCIAKALYRNPRLLVLDEPTSALTESETDTLMGIISGLRERGISCIYISHKLDEVFRIADRITVLRDGQTISTIERGDFDADRVVRDMVGRDIADMYPKVHVKFGAEMLRVENLAVPSRIKGRYLLRDVSFSVRAGEILGFGGLVGAGRSELVNAIFGALPREGHVFVEGTELPPMSIESSISGRLGLLTEDRKLSGFVGTMNLRENISLASFYKIFKHGFIRRSTERKEAMWYFDKLRVKASGLEDSINTLSGGNQQKIVLAKWLMSDVRVLFLDEPTRGIDVGSKVEIYNIMNDLASSGVAIIMISSETTELLAMCDNVIVLYGGRIQRKFDERRAVTQDAYIKAATGL